MLRVITSALGRLFEWIGLGLGYVLGWLLRPFIFLFHWLGRAGLVAKFIAIACLALFVGLYGYFFWTTQVWTGFDPDYPVKYTFEQPKADNPAVPAAEGELRTCVRSGVVDVTADLIDFNVNENAWVSSMLLYKLGFFGLDWDDTPFFDNKASFQRGVNQAVRRTTVELVDTLGRLRGTSQVDGDLQKARGNMQFDEGSWYFGLHPFGPKTPTPSYYRNAMNNLRAFNTRMASCDAQFDARGDNLLQFIDRIANDLGATSAILRERSENHNGGWFDMRADDRFWFAYGQLYGYYGILHAARHDFNAVIQARGLGSLWQGVDDQLKAALRIRPAIISNGREDGWIMPTHLATMGFYVLRVRSNLVELRSVLDR